MSFLSGLKQLLGLETKQERKARILLQRAEAKRQAEADRKEAAIRAKEAKLNRAKELREEKRKREMVRKARAFVRARKLRRVRRDDTPCYVNKNGQIVNYAILAYLLGDAFRQVTREDFTPYRSPELSYSPSSSFDISSSSSSGGESFGGFGGGDSGGGGSSGSW